MDWKSEYKYLLWLTGIFLFTYFMPVGNVVFNEALYSAFELTRWYAREHILLCLLPAFFIAGVIAVFVSQNAVIKYFGAAAKKWLSFLVASFSGTILAVCSCTILPLFAGIYKRGAGIGPAINILAIILTARILGLELGIARVVGAVLFAVIIGLLMHVIYRREEAVKATHQMTLPMEEEGRPLWQTATHFFILVAILIFATWGAPEGSSGLWAMIRKFKWWLVAIFAGGLAFSLIGILKIKLMRVVAGASVVAVSTLLVPSKPLIPFVTGIVVLSILISFGDEESQAWMAESWSFAKQILPLLAVGVLAAGFFLGSPEGGKGIIPDTWISGLVGGNSLGANLFASVVGAFMYFATLTEVPILQGLINAGMGKGPALALLLAGPALSLPNMLVIRSVMGTQKTLVYVVLVTIMATLSGLLFGGLF